MIVNIGRKTGNLVHSRRFNPIITCQNFMLVRTRFAPSPTGVLHIGSVRTALFSWLFARKHDGIFVLRIEDTDRKRSTKSSVDAILEGVDWLGLGADEGPIYQTDRIGRYQEILQAWLESGEAYRCYCTPEELDSMRQEQIAKGENPHYDGRCRDRQNPGHDTKPVIRFRSPNGGRLTVKDLVKGDVEFDSSLIDDLIIARSDGTPTYNFSVVIDDADMKITHVIRGDDHLNNTPKQLNMFAALGEKPPMYAHLPMILGADGGRLSKRHGAVNVLEYRDAGYLPEALLNYLVRLGWSHGDQEIFSIDEMIDLFDITDVNQSAASFNPEKLEWLNQQHIIRAPTDRLVEFLRPQMRKSGIDCSHGPTLHAVVEAYRERSRTLAEMASACRYCFEDIDEYDSKSVKKHLRPAVLEPLLDMAARLEQIADWTEPELASVIAECAAARQIKLGKIGQPLRVAITGGPVSPPIDVTLGLVGRERSISRIRRAITLIEERAASQSTK